MITARATLDLRTGFVFMCLREWVGRSHILLCGRLARDRRKYTSLRCQGWDLLKCGNLGLEISYVFHP